MSPDALLRMSPTVSAMPVGDELTLFDSATGLALSLNCTAADIVALADGTTTLATILAILARHYGVALQVAEQQAQTVIDSLLDAGMLQAD